MELMELPGGESRVRLRLSGLEEVERWVLGWGGHATVIQPSPARGTAGSDCSGVIQSV
jgi:hypothetical protein